MQKTFAQNVEDLAKAIEEMGSPFTENSNDLLVLDSRDLADPAIIDSVRKIEKLGQEQYDIYVGERLVNQTKSVWESIKKNNLALFSRPPIREKTKSQLQLACFLPSFLPSFLACFSRLYVASQVRNGNLDEFFEHENQAYPPALSQNGKLRTGTKSDLVSCLEELVNSRDNATHPSVEVIILDGSVIVNMLRPGSAKTFSDYALQVFLPYVASQLQQASRVDIVWDEYRPDSLKAETRVKRGKGVRRRVEASTPIPGNWQEFLRTDENKVELFSFLANRVHASKPKSKFSALFSLI